MLQLLIYICLLIGFYSLISWLVQLLISLYRHTLRKPIKFAQKYGKGCVVISGALTQIGREYAKYWAMQKFGLILIGNDSKALEEQCNEISRRYSVPTAGVTFLNEHLNTTDDIWQPLYSEIKKEAREEPIVGLICASEAQFAGRIDQIKQEDADAVLLSSEMEAVYLSRLLVDDLKVNRSGFMIYTGSFFGKHSTANLGMVQGAGAFLRNFAQSLAYEQQELDILCVSPLDTSNNIAQVVAGSMIELGRRVESFGTKGNALKDWLYSSLPGFLSKGLVNSAAATAYNDQPFLAASGEGKKLN